MMCPPYPLPPLLPSPSFLPSALFPAPGFPSRLLTSLPGLLRPQCGPLSSDQGAFPLTHVDPPPPLLLPYLLVASQVPTHGLLNAISAPHLSEGSSYHAAFSSERSREAAESQQLVAQDAEDGEAEEEGEEQDLQPLLRASDGSSGAPPADGKSNLKVLDHLRGGQPGGSDISVAEEAPDDAASKQGGRVYVNGQCVSLYPAASLHTAPIVRSSLLPPPFSSWLPFIL